MLGLLAVLGTGLGLALREDGGAVGRHESGDGKIALEDDGNDIEGMIRLEHPTSTRISRDST